MACRCSRHYPVRAGLPWFAVVARPRLVPHPDIFGRPGHTGGHFTPDLSVLRAEGVREQYLCVQPVVRGGNARQSFRPRTRTSSPFSHRQDRRVSSRPKNRRLRHWKCHPEGLKCLNRWCPKSLTRSPTGCPRQRRPKSRSTKAVDEKHCDLDAAQPTGEWPVMS